MTVKISILGDSISTLQGWNPPGFLVFYSPWQLKPEDTWWMHVIKKLEGSLLVNNSFCGCQAASASRVCETFPAGCSLPRINLGADPDVIFIYLGINDVINGVELFGDRLDCLEGGYHRILEQLEQRYPQAIIFAILLPGFDEANEAIKKAAEAFRAICIPVSEYETFDGYHPTAAGMHQLGDQILAECLPYVQNLNSQKRI